MSNNCSDKKNPLVHGGTSQLDRYLAQLKPNHILVNEKTMAQWISFSSMMAQQLNYFNNQNIIDGKWSSFFDPYPLTNYAKLSLEDVEAIRAGYQEQLAKLQAPEHTYYTSELIDAVTSLFDGIFTICVFIDQQLSSSDPESNYHARLEDLVTNKLKNPLGRMLGYYKGAVNHYLADESIVPPVGEQVFGTPFVTRPTFVSALRSPRWFDADSFNGINSFTDYYNSIAEDTSVFARTSTDLPQSPTDTLNDPFWQCLTRASRHNSFTGVIDVFLYACSYIKQLTAQTFNDELNSSNFPPHIALCLTCLNILKQAQDDLNQFTERHLDFFYEKVLRSSPLPAEPNDVHVTVELGKQLNNYLLPKGTKFKAGKDSAGKDVAYALTEDTVFNQAKIGAIKGFYQAGSGDNGVTSNGLAIINNGKAFASQVSNSADGLGKEIKDVPAVWHPFGNKTVSNTGSVTMLMPTSKVGFAFASEYLYLQEGQRQINVKIYTGFLDLLPFNNVMFSCELTTAKGWKSVNSLTPNFHYDGSGLYLEFDITLDPKFPAVTGYEQAVHGPEIDSDLPVIRFLLDDDNFNVTGNFQKLRFTQFTKCAIRVAVGTWAGSPGSVSAQSFNGLKNILLSSNTGGIDAKNPFQPFGNPAKKDSYLMLGNRELFLKPGAQFQVLIENSDLLENRLIQFHYILDTSAVYHSWAEAIYGTIAQIVEQAPTLNFQYLNDSIWGNKRTFNQSWSILGVPESGPIYSSTPFSMLMSDVVAPEFAIDYKQEYGSYGSSTANGFLKINLASDFGYNGYEQDLIQYRISQGTGHPVSGDVPVAPYVPTIKNICINYIATAELEFGQNSPTGKYVTYYHLSPFGAKEVTNAIPNVSALLEGNRYQLGQLSRFQPLIATGNKAVKVSWGRTNPHPATGVQQPIFPQFDGKVGTTKLNFISELYIGLQDAVPDEKVNLLFQVLDGSTNPLIAKPDAHVFWFYLSNNEWISFDKKHLRDNTDQLIRSGIITFDIPADADMDNTLLPKGYIWLKAGITQFPDAVCKLIDIKAQAALLEFNDNNNAADFLKNQLPANTISKLLSPLGAIKKIIQPFDSFGGKTAEGLDAFRVRISERIRHKDRAIQIDNYEKLILQQFSTIQKVKCLNHTRLEQGVIYNEQAPGHVTIITIPYINENSSAGVLKPYTSTNQLAAINEFISSRISPHVTLHVNNPLFEEISVRFKAHFVDGADRTYYSNLLRQEILRFLSPWAYDDHAKVSFGGKIYKSTIIDFIEDRAYVDYITDVMMFHRPDGSSQWSQDSDTITASTARSVLVSVPAEFHDVSAI